MMLHFILLTAQSKCVLRIRSGTTGYVLQLGLYHHFVQNDKLINHTLVSFIPHYTHQLKNDTRTAPLSFGSQSNKIHFLPPVASVGTTNLPVIERRAQSTHMIRLIPTLPASRKIPFGETKIPDPTMEPTIRATPLIRLTCLLSTTPEPWLAVSPPSFLSPAILILNRSIQESVQYQ